MSNAGGLVARLAEAGIDPQLLADVAQELFTAEAERKILAERRENERARKARSRDGAGQGVTDADTPGPGFLDKEKPPTPPKEINPSRVCETRARGWHRLPESWEPRPLPIPVQAKVDQWPPGELGDVLADFRRWAANAEDKNGKGRKLDWDQAWRNWIGRRHDERHSRKPANGNHPGLGKTSAAIAGLGNWDDDRPM